MSLRSLLATVQQITECSPTFCVLSSLFSRSQRSSIPVTSWDSACTTFLPSHLGPIVPRVFIDVLSLAWRTIQCTQCCIHRTQGQSPCHQTSFSCTPVQSFLQRTNLRKFLTMASHRALHSFYLSSKYRRSQSTQ